MQTKKPSSPSSPSRITSGSVPRSQSGLLGQRNKSAVLSATKRKTSTNLVTTRVNTSYDEGEDDRSTKLIFILCYAIAAAIFYLLTNSLTLRPVVFFLLPRILISNNIYWYLGNLTAILFVGLIGNTIPTLFQLQNKKQKINELPSLHNDNNQVEREATNNNTNFSSNYNNITRYNVNQQSPRKEVYTSSLNSPYPQINFSPTNSALFTPFQPNKIK